MIDLFRNRKHLKLLCLTDEEGVYELELDNSTMSKFTCPRMWFHYAVLGRDSWPSTALIFGGNLHKGLDVLHRTNNIRTAEEELIKAFEDRPTQEGEWRNLGYARDVIKKYHEAYGGQFQLGMPALKDSAGEPYIERNFRLFMFEIELNANVPYPKSLLVRDSDDDSPNMYIKKVRVFWTGKQDILVERDGIWTGDHKTTSVDSQGFWADFDLSPQMIGYTWAAKKQLNRHIAGVIINAIFLRKPTPSGKGTTFERKYYQYTDFHIDEWLRDTKETIFLALESLIEGYFRKHPASCVGKFSICSYHSVCTKSNPDQQEIMLSSDLFTEKVWSPLTEEIKVKEEQKSLPPADVTSEIPFLP